MTTPIIQFIDVCKSYQSGSQPITALEAVNLSLDAGDFATIMGPSGGGKTTLLNLLAGLDLPDRGKIILNGREVSDFSDHELTLLRRKEIGIVFQFFNLMPTLTVMENVELPLLLAHSSRTDEKHIKILLDYVGLLHRAESFPNELSGGEMQRVAIARALVHRPSILLADEPTGNLDSENGLKILDLMKQASTDFGATVIMVTHNPQVAKIGNRHYEIRDGKLTNKTP
ncbi:MAG: ABC transporter ATP-binding protein [Nitrospina sp.]|jgi:putative ABC transport system ATP-binding protein|nr:ABC transporter ATP-binding protein [Nitrospina sp.]MBT5631246.1 ABC transporter ATP-binding protein [Nitrospina sp.]